MIRVEAFQRSRSEIKIRRARIVEKVGRNDDDNDDEDDSDRNDHNDGNGDNDDVTDE